MDDGPKATSFQTTVAPVGEHLEVMLSGELDSDSSSGFEHEILKLINQGHRRFVFCFDNLRLVTSAGLRVLLVVSKLLKENGGDSSIYGCSATVQEIFRMTGFDKTLKLQDSYSDAVCSVGSKVTVSDGAD